jgi:arsenate reductase (thioredoxin)
MSDRERVLFVCTGNRARSQMAEGLLRHIAGDKFDVYSAGTLPSGISELTIEAMREIGIDVSSQRSKSVAEFDGQRFDHVITVCDTARETCPVFPGGNQLHWSIEDPSDAEARGIPIMEAFRLAREDLHRRIEMFVSERQA